MSRNEWTRLFVKLFALFQITSSGIYLVLFSPILSLVNQFQGLGDPQVTIPLAGLFLGVIFFPLIIGLALWINASRVSNWIWGKTSAETKTSRKKPDLFQIKLTVITVLGLYIFVTTLPSWINSFGNIFANWLFFSSISDTSVAGLYKTQDYVRWLALLIQFLVSVLFMFAPKRVLVFLEKAQKTWDSIT